MEYLSRVLQRLKRIPDFNFHSRCEKLSIINWSFANDLLIFPRGDTRSVALAMEAFEEFSQSTSLVVNPSKRQVYFGSLEDDTRQAIQILTKFQEGSLPFKYLGIPLTSKKLTNTHCLILMDKLVARIRHWSSKLLSFAGRMQLVNNILLATTYFLMQFLPLPKKIIHIIEALCRSFL
ncbi:uncharacterized protein LOC131639779 [Vicia villosa]|uniref:uncharacterized protein LOC131639779 n=1 Tax=Vicia villosa TaxID=3911 RepID=UPI00273A8FE6|nr:uncharacterized protein LOC131639779 [Vicia villosa]